MFQFFILPWKETEVRFSRSCSNVRTDLSQQCDCWLVSACVHTYHAAPASTYTSRYDSARLSLSPFVGLLEGVYADACLPQLFLMAMLLPAAARFRTLHAVER